jgi:predicted RNase H-like nuclease (RuvC/YqgF family)
MSAEDLYVIQGPPGTGKTTVISEICLQNAKSGLRTLVASQSNLAVDNALGRLLANKDIRILRVGRTESIEEEGKKFIEENVGQYWKDHTLQDVSTQFEADNRRETQIEAEWEANEQEEEQFQKELARVESEMEAKKKAEQQFNEIQSVIDQFRKEEQGAEQERKTLQQQLLKIEQALHLLSESIEKDERFLTGQPDIEVIQTEWYAIQQEITQLQNCVAFQALEDFVSAEDCVK